jgi:predicted  nucleic acid-binding Zn-ribbon protein
LSIIKRFFGKKEEIPLQTSVKFNELPGWIETESAQRFSELRSHIRQKYDEINKVLEDIGESRDQLIDAKFGEKVFVKMAKAGASNRENVVKNLNIIKERISVPEDTDPAVASEFHMNAKSILSNSLENAIRSQQYVKLLFPEEYKGVLFDLKHLDAVLEELILPINNLKHKLKAYERLPGEIKVIDQTRQQIEDMKKRIPELEKKHESLKNNLPGLESELKELEKSNEFIKAQELEKQVKICKEQISGIDSNIRELFAPLSKALSRVEKQDKSGRHTLSPENRNILNLLIEDPVSALKLDIAPFLIDLKARVEDGSLGLKQQKMNKIIEQINKLTGSDILSSIDDQRDSRLLKLVRFSEELKGLTVYKEKTQIKGNIYECKGKIYSTEQELDDDRRELERLTEEIRSLKGDLDSNLSYVFERDIKVEY